MKFCKVYIDFRFSWWVLACLDIKRMFTQKMLIFSAGGLFQKDYWKFGVIDFPKYQPSVVASET